MPLGQKNILATVVLATLFLMAQVLCACLPTAAETSQISSLAPTAVAQSDDHGDHHDDGHHEMSMAMTMSHGHAGHVLPEPPPASPEPESEAPCSSDSGHHDHVADCSHCDGASLIATVIDLPTGTTTDLPSQKTILVVSALPSPLRAGMAGTNLAGLRWRDPPAQTPVTLKTLALI